MKLVFIKRKRFYKGRFDYKLEQVLQEGKKQLQKLNQLGLSLPVALR